VRTALIPITDEILLPYPAALLRVVDKPIAAVRLRTMLLSEVSEAVSPRDTLRLRV